MEILLLRLDFWDWLAFGTVLLLLEIFGAGGYLLRVGLTAACVGALGALLPGLAWPWQVGLFVLLSGLVAALIGAVAARPVASRKRQGCSDAATTCSAAPFPCTGRSSAGSASCASRTRRGWSAVPTCRAAPWSESPARTAPCCTSSLPRPESL